MALILGGLIILGAIAMALLIVFAAGMSDSPSAAEGAGGQALGVLITGVVIGGIVIATHWMHLSW